MDELRRWLTTRGLAKYIEVFEEAEVDWSVLPSLDTDDLKELGLSLGARKKVLQGIDELARGEPVTSAVIDAAPDTVMVSAVTNGLMRGDIETEQLGPLALKGLWSRLLRTARCGNGRSLRLMPRYATRRRWLGVMWKSRCCSEPGTRWFNSSARPFCCSEKRV